MKNICSDYLTGIYDAYMGPVGKLWTNNSATSIHYEISKKSRDYLAKGPLRRSMDVYAFIRSLFWARVKAFNLGVPVEDNKE